MDTNTGTAPQTIGTSNPVRYGGFWIRVLAVIIDGILLAIVSGGLAAILHIPYQANGQNTSADALTGFLGLIYFTLMESSSYQATLGKMIAGLKVTDLEGNRISLPKAIARYLSKIISGIILGIGFLMVAFTSRKQGLHDKLAGTLVMKK